MSKRRAETGFGDEIDNILNESDDEGVLMTGGAEVGDDDQEDEEEEEDEFVGAQLSMTGEDNAADADEEDDKEDAVSKGGSEDREIDTELVGGRNAEYDEYLTEDDDDLPETENIESSENIFNILDY